MNDVEQRMKIHMAAIHDAMATNSDMLLLIKTSLSLRDEYLRTGKSMQDWDALCERIMNHNNEEQ